MKNQLENLNNSNNNNNLSIDKLNLYCITWNLLGKIPKEDELNIILPKKNFYHIYSIGTEECMRSILASFFYSNKSAYEDLLQKYFGDEYFVIKSENLDAIHLIVLAHISIKNNITNISSGLIKNGIGNVVGNKGAVSISFNYNYTSLIFINCHLCAGHTLVKNRNYDFDRINTELQLSNIDSIKKDKTITDQFDIAIWSGDFNYRIDTDKTYLKFCLADRSEFLIDNLIEYDQMINEINKGNLKFNNFIESKIKFFPTYKLEIGTDNYVIDEERLPGWTDRIIYKSAIKSFLIIKEYNWIKEVYSSDHKPVYAIFELNIPKKTQNEKVQSSKSNNSKTCLLF